MESLSKYLLVSAIFLFVLVFYKWLLRYLQRKQITQKFVYFFPFEKRYLGDLETLTVDMPFGATISVELYFPDGSLVKQLHVAELEKGLHQLTLDFSDVENAAYTLRIKSPFQLTHRKVEIKRAEVTTSPAGKITV